MGNSPTPSPRCICRCSTGGTPHLRVGVELQSGYDPSDKRPCRFSIDESRPHPLPFHAKGTSRIKLFQITMSSVTTGSFLSRFSPRRRRSIARAVDNENCQTGTVNDDSSVRWTRRSGRTSQPRNRVSMNEVDGPSGAVDRVLGRQLLDLLGLMGYHGVEHFVIPGTARWNKRRGLGQGISFAVEEASLPLTMAVSSLSLHRPHGRLNHNQNRYFTDHTGRRWNFRTRVAFKIPESPRYDLLDVIQEVHILCHPPLQDHPNIVSLLGIAWLNQPKGDSTQLEEDMSQRDRPTVVIEQAPHGALYDFLRTSSYMDQHVSLKTKLRLCIDVLNAMSVS